VNLPGAAYDLCYAIWNTVDMPALNSVGPEETAMDWDRVEGSWKEVKGKVKEKWSKLTDDDLTAGGAQKEVIGRVSIREIEHKAPATSRGFRARADHDALGHAASAEVALAPGHQYSQHVVTPLGNVAEAGKPLLGPGQQLR
jgi:uncharacterized protein YjbJ (UPF0337 family)